MRDQDSLCDRVRPAERCSCLGLLLALTVFLASCGVSPREHFYGLSPADNSLAARVGNDTVPQYAADPARAADARSKLVANHPEWEACTQAAIRAGEVNAGMTRAQASAAWGLGFLREIKPVKYANRIRRERFWFDCAPLLAALYFVDDTLIAIRFYDEAGQPVPMSLGPSGLGYTRPKRADPVIATHDPVRLTQSIFPEWARPMTKRPVAADIP